MERRDFFGILAAPLLKRFTPPVPLSSKPLAEALQELARQQDYSVRITTGSLTFKMTAKVSAEAWVDDDLGAFRAVAKRMGLSARQHQDRMIAEMFR